VSIILPLFVMWTVSITSSIGPNACLFSKRCWVNFDLLSLKCPWNLILKGPPVCPVYFILQSEQVSRYIPLLSYLLWSVPCFVARRLSIVLTVVNVTLTSVFLNSFVINLVSFPIHVNFAHLIFWVSLFFLLSNNFVQGRGFVIVVDQDLLYSVSFFLLAFGG
jgi:hypothetical protein